MTTVDAIEDLTGLDKASQLDLLRRRMATVPGRRDHAPADLPATAAPERVEPVVGDDPEPLTAAVRGKTLRTMPVPPPLAALLPRRALARGTAITVTGAGSVLIALIAETSAAGHHVALIGQPRLSLLAVHEHGGNLAKVHLVNPGSTDPLDAASICLDGVDLVVTTVHGRDVPPTRARALLARNRRHASILILTDGHMPGIDLTIASTVHSYGGIEQGRGRIKSIALETTVHGRGTPQRTGRYTLTAPSFGEKGLRWTHTRRRTYRPTTARSRTMTTANTAGMFDVNAHYLRATHPPHRRSADVSERECGARDRGRFGGGRFRDTTALKIRAEGLYPVNCCRCNRLTVFGSPVLSRNAAPPNVVEMSVHHQNFQHLLDKAQGYLTRVQALTVAAGSEMDHDDQYFAPIRRSFQETPMQLVGSAADHLRLVGMSGANQPELNPFASATLVRSAITSAATSLWVLHGAQKIRRIHMLEVLAHDSASYRTFITNTRAMHTTDEATTEVNRELESMDRRDQWIITEYNALAGPTVKNKTTIKQVSGAVTDTEMVCTAGDMLGSALATRGLSSGQEVLAMWQRLSGYAHGRAWAYLPNKTSTGPADASGLERVRIDGDPMFIIGGAAAAMELIEKSFRLLDTLVA